MKKVLLITFLLVMISHQNTLSQSCGDDPELYGEQLEWWSLHEPGTLNPVLATSRIEHLVTDLMFNYLLSMDPRNYVTKGELVEKWEPPTPIAGKREGDPPRMRMRLHLKKGVRWSDENDFDVRDVVFTYRTAMTPGTRSLLRSRLSIIESMHPINDHTVDVLFRQVVDDRIAINALHFKIIPHHPFLHISREDLEEVDQIKYVIPFNHPFNHNAAYNACTGPFRLKAWSQYSSITLGKNNKYTIQSKKPYLKDIFLQFVGHESSIEGPLRHGAALDLFLDLTPTLMSEVNTSGMDVVTKDAISFTFIGVNHRTLGAAFPDAPAIMARALCRSFSIFVAIDRIYGLNWNAKYVNQITGPAPFKGGMGSRWHREPCFPDALEAKELLSLYREKTVLNGEIRLRILYQGKSELQRRLKAMIEYALENLDMDISLSADSKPKPDYQYWPILQNNLVDPDNGDVYDLVLFTAYPPGDLVRYYHDQWSSMGPFNFLSYQTSDALIKQSMRDYNPVNRLQTEHNIFLDIRGNHPAVWLWSKKEIIVMSHRLKGQRFENAPLFDNIQCWFKKR